MGTIILDATKPLSPAQFPPRAQVPDEAMAAIDLERMLKPFTGAADRKVEQEVRPGTPVTCSVRQDQRERATGVSQVGTHTRLARGLG